MGLVGATAPAELDLTRDDEIFPLFIVEEMPTGLSGLLLAGILAVDAATGRVTGSLLTPDDVWVVAPVAPGQVAVAAGDRLTLIGTRPSCAGDPPISTTHCGERRAIR